MNELVAILQGIESSLASLTLANELQSHTGPLSQKLNRAELVAIMANNIDALRLLNAKLKKEIGMVG